VAGEVNPRKWMATAGDLFSVVLLGEDRILCSPREKQHSKPNEQPLPMSGLPFTRNEWRLKHSEQCLKHNKQRLKDSEWLLKDNELRLKHNEWLLTPK